MLPAVTPTEALADIRGYATANRIRLTGHASLRMQQRGADFRDVRSALMTATACTAQENGAWRVEGGVDRDGDDLTVVAALEQGVVVITVF
jgi:hypothetical protein